MPDRPYAEQPDLKVRAHFRLISEDYERRWGRIPTQTGYCSAGESGRVCWLCGKQIRQGDPVIRSGGWHWHYEPGKGRIAGRKLRHGRCSGIIRIPLPPQSASPLPDALRIAVTGGRDYTNYLTIATCLTQVMPVAALAQGGARGADRLARRWARANGIKPVTFEADWDRYGHGAGLIRNGVMLDEFKPELLVAFPGGTGTADCVGKAHARGVPVWMATEQPCPDWAIVPSG